MLRLQKLIHKKQKKRPQELDEAARRRMVKRLYIPLPDQPARFDLISRLLRKEEHSLDKDQLDDIAREAAGYSGADCKALCAEVFLCVCVCVCVCVYIYIYINIHIY